MHTAHSVYNTSQCSCVEVAFVKSGKIHLWPPAYRVYNVSHCYCVGVAFVKSGKIQLWPPTYSIFFYCAIHQQTNQSEVFSALFIANKEQTSFNMFIHGEGDLWWVIIFWGRGTRVMTPIQHLRMSHHSDAHHSCTLMLPVSKHDAHLSPMEWGAMVSHHFLGEGDLKHDAHLSP